MKQILGRFILLKIALFIIGVKASYELGGIHGLWLKNNGGLPPMPWFLYAFAFGFALLVCWYVGHGIWASIKAQRIVDKTDWNEIYAWLDEHDK